MNYGGGAAHHPQPHHHQQQFQAQKQLREDWGNREFTEVISTNIKQIADFLTSFGRLGFDLTYKGKASC